MTTKTTLLLSLIFFGSLASDLPAADLRVVDGNNHLLVTLDDVALVKYVFQDKEISRPYFTALKTRSGTQVTRNHPPQPGVDAVDHAELHPGLWMAFGDINGSDSWRLKSKVVHEGFVGDRVIEKERIKFTVRNRHETNDRKPLLQELSTYEVVLREDGWLLEIDTTFEPTEREVAFGDQEEMGLGVRVATPLTVKGGGQITNSHGDKNEKGCWGKRSDWCDYSGALAGNRCGILVLCHPDNFEPCAFHTRDYGFMAANPFAKKAFGLSDQPARTVVRPGEKLRLRFGVFVYSRQSAVDGAAEFKQYAKSN